MDEMRCACCRTRFRPKHNPYQHYCGASLCQKKRRSRYQQKKLKEDSVYEETHRSSQEKWRAMHPHYWRTYRSTHQHYVDSNRLLQAARDQRRKGKAVGFRAEKVDNTTEPAEKAGHKNVLANMCVSFLKMNYFSFSYSVNLGKENGLQICTL